VAAALHLVSTLLDRDIRLLAKSRNVPASVGVAARRFIQRKG
jgi:hypothetical protein